jgi:cytochrome P450
VIANDLLFPASTTVTSTINFAMAFLLKYPEVQTKVHQELDAVVGRDRLPTLDDRARSVQISVPIMNIVRNTAVATSQHYRTFCNMVCEILEMK